MKTSEIIDGLEDLIQDRESFATPANDKFYDKDNPFRYDIEVLQAAIDKLRRAEPENKACPVSRLQANEASITLLEIMEDGVADQQKALSIAYKALYWIANSRRAEPENKPLTVEQLRKMDGKLVWAVCRNINAPPCLMRVQNFNNRCATDDKEYYELFADYGKTWLAYARKPEGSETNE